MVMVFLLDYYTSLRVAYRGYRSTLYTLLEWKG